MSDSYDDDDVTVIGRPITQVGVVLYAEFVDYLKSGAGSEDIVTSAERRQFESLVALARGQVFSRQGGEFSAFVPDESQALDLCAHMLELMQQWRRQDGEREGLSGRVVAEHGRVTMAGGRVTGDIASVLPQMIRSLPQNSIGLLPEFFELSKDMLPGPPSRVRVEGAGGRADIIYVVKLDANHIELSPPPAEAEEAKASVEDLALELLFESESREIVPGDCPVTVGRHPSSGIFVEAIKGSRFHGRIEYHDGKFHFIDDSRNGTYIQSDGTPEFMLRKDGVVLQGAGTISPGSSITDAKSTIIHFRCHAASAA